MSPSSTAIPRPAPTAACSGCSDSSPQIGNGAELPFEVTVKRPPTAEAGPDVVVAPGEAVTFDGSGSTPGDRPIARYSWDFQDGTPGDGVRAGAYVRALRAATW